MNFPKTDNGVKFGEIMAEIWEEDASHLYREWHNARKAAEACGAIRKYAFRTSDGPGYCYQFTDGSRVAIATHGGLVEQVTRRGHFA